MIIVSCASKVPDLIAKYNPDCIVSISKKIQLPDHINKVFLDFADIEEPNSKNIKFAANIDHINLLRSIQYEVLLIHCTQGQRRSPAAALIILGGGQDCFDLMKFKAPYINPNPWMLKLAGITIKDSPRVAPKSDCFYIIDEEKVE